LLGSIAAQLFPPLEQGGLTVWHLPPVVDEHLWVADLCLLVTVKPADPKALPVDEPAFTHPMPPLVLMY
jgi:hypothetical protein